MAKKDKVKLSKGQLRTIIVTAVSAVIVLVILIINAFIPVKYFFSYTVAGNKGAPDGVMRVRFVDVGYGDCAIVELPDGKNMLIDGGNGRSSNQSKILKYLNSCGIKTIDYLLCTTVNRENCGGLAELITLKEVKRIYMPYCTVKGITDEYHSFRMSANSSGAQLFISSYGAGEKNAEYGYTFRVLSPSYYSDPEGWYAKLNADPSSQTARNDASAVIWLEYAGTSFLFTSDAGGGALAELASVYGGMSENYLVNLSDCDIVTVANHGNSNSACTQFYDVVAPQAAILSVGENGSGSPSEEVLSDVGSHVGDKLYRTDKDGTVTVEVTRDGYEIKF